MILIEELIQDSMTSLIKIRSPEFIPLFNIIILEEIRKIK